MRVTFIGHSGFLVETATAYFLFDYFHGGIPALDRDKPLVVFASHKHRDHYNPEIFNLFEDYPWVCFVLDKDCGIKWKIREWMDRGMDLTVKLIRVRKNQKYDLVMPGEILGYVTREAAERTGLPAGVPVVATSNDKAVEGLGTGCMGDTTACLSLGTYTTAMMEGKENLKGTSYAWPKFSCVPNKYLYDSNGIRRGMWTISWFREVLGESYIKMAEERGMSAEELLSEEAAKVPTGSDGLMTVLDWLAPVDTRYKKGIMIGFDGRTTRGHIYRSLLEAVAMTMKKHVDDMSNEVGVTLDKMIVTGGGSNSDLFMQILADVFNMSTVRNEVNGAAGLGSAICAAVAAGVYGGFDEAVEGMVRIKDTFEPDPEHVKLYQKMLPIYLGITEHTDEVLKKTYEIFS